MLKPIEKKICKELNLNLGMRKHNLDFVLSRRSENIVLFMLKLNYNRLTEKNLIKGSLRPELAYSLCKLADIEKKDVCLDMFCGSLSICKQATKHFKYNMFFNSDINVELIKKFKKEFKNNNKKVYIKNCDAHNLNYINSDFVDKIITDPPWNIFDKQDQNFESFYYKFLCEVIRILKVGGLAVILMGNINDFEKAKNKIKNLLQEKVLHILVNGKKQMFMF